MTDEPRDRFERRVTHLVERYLENQYGHLKQCLRRYIQEALLATGGDKDIATELAIARLELEAPDVLEAYKLLVKRAYVAATLLRDQEEPSP